ncbi:MAG: hypothetical protein JW726_01660 [Anaerolineales bacterium]|nr:hypothetical protein [Anaerolineales bacterium]
MYEKLAGMSGTAITEAEEFDKIYKLDVLAIPTNLEYRASQTESGLVVMEDRDEEGYKYHCYVHKDDAEKKPVYWQRKDYPDVVYRTQEMKFRAAVAEILHYHALGRPVLVGTTSVEMSDQLSNRLRAEPLRRLAQVMTMRNVWLEKHQRQEDGRLVEELQPLNAPLDTLQQAELRKMARELEISTNPEDPGNLSRLLNLLGLQPAYEQRLKACFQGGIPHKVLNAREHTQESRVIAGAGALGAVTIATNMAGRGVDIKLGGELDEDIVAYIKRYLRNNGLENPYGLSNADMLQALLNIILHGETFQAPVNGDTAAHFQTIRVNLIEKYDQRGMQDEWQQISNILYNQFDVGLKAAENIIPFWKHTEEEQRVRNLQGLAVIGSERHEARRIDNQLRGRSSRQGDPGSSRFYLSLQDELMVRFGGDQAEGLMKRMRIDDAVPMEMGLVSRLVEGSQTRVEGANFDTRKHLLEYDDVLNQQRQRIYAQRDRIFTKDDLSEDVTEILRTEVLQRVPDALKDEAGPWKLLAWLDQIQPPLSIGYTVFPSYSLQLLLDYLTTKTYSKVEDLRQALLEVAERALKAEEKHLLNVVETLLETTRSRLENQINERLETLDTIFEGLSLGEGEEGEQRSPRQIQDEISSEMHVPIRLTAEEQRLLRDDPRKVKDNVQTQVENALANQAIVRLLGAVERRLEESLELNSAQVPSTDWDELSRQVITAIESVLNKRREHLLGNGSGSASGLIGKDLDSALGKIQGSITTDHLTALLGMMPQGTRATFDKKTHRRVIQRTTRLVYIYFAAELLAQRDLDAIADEVLQHLEKAQSVIRNAWGLSEFSRLAKLSLAEIDENMRTRLCNILGEESCRALGTQPLQALEKEQIGLVINALGRMALTVIYRQLLLSVISELWVEYLTQMEALRVSIGLEAYAQRDPLVEYKSKASALFQELLSNMRSGVITRMFTYRPRDLSALQTEARRGTTDQQLDTESDTIEAQDELPEEQLEGEPQEQETEPTQRQAMEGLSKSQKRRRRRR